MRERIALVMGVLALVVAATACDKVEPVGEVRNREVVIERDGAASVVLEGKVVWLFGDTFTSRGYVHSSVATASLSDPTTVTDTLREGVPLQAVPYTSAERAQNDANDGHWVIWPASAIATSSTSAVVLSSKFHATAAGWVEPSLVVSTLRAGETQSVRVAEPLKAPDANYATGPFLDKGIVYLMDCGGVNVPPQLVQKLLPGAPLVGDLLGIKDSGRCRIARVALENLTDRSAYRFWSGTAWVAAIDSAAAVVPGSNSGLSVAYSPKLKKYVSVSVQGFSKDIQYATAPAPQGPWSAPRTVLTAETDAYAVRIHPELSAPDMSTIAVSYFRQDQPGKKGAVVLVRVTPG